MKTFFTILITLVLIMPTFADTPAKRVYFEKDYQNAWCLANYGVTEYVLPDKARVDCVTTTHAIEFDFADKWGESIGQALYYGTALNKKSGIVLIMENETKDKKYLDRVMAVAQKHDITVWTITPNYVKAKRDTTPAYISAQPVNLVKN